MEKDEQDRREPEELRELNVDLQDRQRDRRLEQQILVGHSGHGHGQIGHDGDKDQPGRMRGVARVVDGLE